MDREGSARDGFGKGGAAAFADIDSLVEEDAADLVAESDDSLGLDDGNFAFE